MLPDKKYINLLVGEIDHVITDQALMLIERRRSELIRPDQKKRLSHHHRRRRRGSFFLQRFLRTNDNFQTQESLARARTCI